MQRIDAHAHTQGGDHPEVQSLYDELDLAAFNICVITSPADQPSDWRERQRAVYRGLAERWPERYRWITTFDLPDFDEPDYVDRVIAELDQDFADGAIAVKAWKNIGMELRTPAGEFMQIDDPLLTPIFEHLERQGRVVLMHIGEPWACWQPLDPENPHYGYYSKHQQWHMYGRDDYPSHETIMAAWDRMLERHRELTVIGAHMGSQEYDVRVVAKRFERFRNYAVDTSARLADLAWQDPAVVREFLDRYGDRVLFGIDIGCPPAGAGDAAIARFIDAYRDQALQSYAYFEREGQVQVMGREVPGLALPEAMLEQLYRGNAERWYRTRIATPA